MTFKTIALGLFVTIIVALIIVNRAPMGRALTAIIARVNTFRYRQVHEEPAPIRYIDWGIRTRVRPRSRAASSQVDTATTAQARAYEALTDAAKTFPGGVAPVGRTLIVTGIVGVIFLVVASASAYLDWTLLYAFTNEDALLATLLALFIISVPIGLSIVGQAILNKSPRRSTESDEEGGEAWSSHAFGSAMIGLGVAYMILLGIVALLGSTRATFAYENAVAQEKVGYAAIQNSIHSEWDPKVNNAELHQKQIEVDPSAREEQELYWKHTLDGYLASRTRELKIAEEVHNDVISSLEDNRSAATQKWVILALLASAGECAFAYGGKSAISLLRLLIARGRHRAAADQLSSATAGRDRAIWREIDLLTRRVAGAGYDPADLDRALADAGIVVHLDGERPHTPSVDDDHDGTSPPPPPEEAEEVIDPLDDDSTDEGPTPGFSEA